MALGPGGNSGLIKASCGKKIVVFAGSGLGASLSDGRVLPGRTDRRKRRSWVKRFHCQGMMCVRNMAHIFMTRSSQARGGDLPPVGEALRRRRERRSIELASLGESRLSNENAEVVGSVDQNSAGTKKQFEESRHSLLFRTKGRSFKGRGIFLEILKTELPLF